MANARNAKDPKLISAVELVKEFNISYQTINHYTNLGLFESVSRIGLKRFYNREGVRERLGTIKELQSKGYTLRLISEIIKNNGASPLNNGLNKK